MSVNTTLLQLHGSSVLLNHTELGITYLTYPGAVMLVLVCSVESLSLFDVNIKIN